MPCFKSISGIDVIAVDFVGLEASTHIMSLLIFSSFLMARKLCYLVPHPRLGGTLQSLPLLHFSEIVLHTRPGAGFFCSINFLDPFIACSVLTGTGYRRDAHQTMGLFFSPSFLRRFLCYCAVKG